MAEATSSRARTLSRAWRGPRTADGDVALGRRTCAVCRGWCERPAVRRLPCRASRRRGRAAAAARCRWPVGVARVRARCLRRPAAVRRAPSRASTTASRGTACSPPSSSTRARPRPRARRACWPTRVRSRQRCARLVLPVPLSRERLRERGYNQAWELARRLARALGCDAPSATCCCASRDTPHQLGLHARERAGEPARRLRRRSRAGAAGLRGARIALVDDVLTTGATAHAGPRARCAPAGARDVRCGWSRARRIADASVSARQSRRCSASSSSIPRSRPTPAT